MSDKSEDPNEDVMYHLAISPGDVAPTVLLPGNPERIQKITAFWDAADQQAWHREFRTVTGVYQGSPISATSTGIGSPSAAIAVEELARVGAETFIRVGSCGAIQPQIGVGELVITAGAVRQEGTSDEYIRDEYPAVADYEVFTALITAAERLGYEYHVGLTASTDSFYAGQGRPGYSDYLAEKGKDVVEELRAAGVLNFEMEASAILTLANLFGLRAGAVCSVYANRVSGEFRQEGERRAAETASLATKILNEMADRKRETSTDHWHAGLSI